MGMALEYPFKTFLYIIIIFMLIGIMWNFRNKIPYCLFGGCEDDSSCDISTERTSEEYIEADQINKYCQLCWMKNKDGECPENVLCYVVLTDYGISSQAFSSSYFDYCEVSCENRNADAIFINYDHYRQKVIVTC